jgi:hypothetical protein
LTDAWAVTAARGLTNGFGLTNVWALTRALALLLTATFASTATLAPIVTLGPNNQGSRELLGGNLLLIVLCAGTALLLIGVVVAVILWRGRVIFTTTYELEEDNPESKGSVLTGPEFNFLTQEAESSSGVKAELSTQSDEMF